MKALFCKDERFAGPDTLAFDDIEGFRYYCRTRFGEVPNLHHRPLNGVWVDDAGRVVLREGSRTPLTDEYAAALKAFELAGEAFTAAEAAQDAAAVALYAAAEALANSDEPRKFTVKWLDGSDVTEEIIASSLEEAAELASDMLRDADYNDLESTIWPEADVWDNVDSDNTKRVRVTVDPAEPKCTREHRSDALEHEWEQVYCRGNGGGVIVHESCEHCGKRRITNTWATNPANGTQGHDSVSYDDGGDDD